MNWIKPKTARWIWTALSALAFHQAAALDNSSPEWTAAQGRVLIVEHPSATTAFNPHPAVVKTMFTEAFPRLMGKPSAAEAWRGLVSTQDVIGIKVHSAPGRYSGTRHAVVGAVIQSLLEAGFSPRQIVVWDRRLVDLRLAGFSDLADEYHVSLAGAMDEGYDPAKFYSTPLIGKLVYGDLEFGRKGEGIGRNSYVSKLLTRRLTRIINITPLLNHNLAGVSGVLHGLAFGSVDNTLRFEDVSRLATAIPEIYALPELADKVALNVVDALICQYYGEERSLLHYSSALNQLWLSTDPVALDVLALQELDSRAPDDQRRKSIRQIYLNAELLELGMADPRKIKIEKLELK